MIQVFNICCMSRIFEEIAEMLRHGLSDAGFTVHIADKRVVSDCYNIILGCHLIDDWKIVPENSILFNFEQMKSHSVLVTSDYIQRLQQFQVWDYSQSNIEFHRENSINAELIRFGFSPRLQRVQPAVQQDIDVLFYGAINERREKILLELREHGLNVVTPFGAFANELDQLIARSKVVLNIHFYESKIFEVVRVSYLLHNQKAIVAEVGPETEIEPELKRCVAAVPYHKLVETCIRLVDHATERKQLEVKSLEVFSQRSQAQFLNEPIKHFLSHTLAKKKPKKNKKNKFSDNVLINHGVFTMWFGSGKMSDNQVRSLASIIQNNGCPNVHITYRTLPKWMHPDFPVHAIFPYLSSAHQSDYLRSYFMHVYGGGYTDIKYSQTDWEPIFDQLINSDAWGCGYAENKPSSVAAIGGKLEIEMRENYQKLIGFSSMILKPRTLFTQQWINQIHALFNTKFELTKLNPARHPLDQTGIKFSDGSVSEYPFSKNEIGINIFHPLVFRYHEKFLSIQEIEAK